VYRRLIEIESRLLPCGLHVIGQPPTAEEAIATLVNIASIDRPEDNLKSLPRIIAESVRRNIDEVYRNADAGMLKEVTLLQKITEGVRSAVRVCVQRSTNDQGRVEEVVPLFKQGLKLFDMLSGGSPWAKSLSAAGFPNVRV
jgi:magnesium chelatase subunit H